MPYGSFRPLEAKDAVANGAGEIDMVINIGYLKDKRYEEVEREIRRVHEACGGRILKVIIETCLLTDEEDTVPSVFPKPS